MNATGPVPRLLLIEDDSERITRFRSWVPDGVPLVVAASAGRAIGNLRNSQPDDYAGILLDHDLQQQTVSLAEQGLSGTQVVTTLIDRIAHDVPVLVHSMNPVGAAIMTRKLEAAGFEVTVIPMERLTRERFTGWLTRTLALWREQWEA